MLRHPLLRLAFGLLIGVASAFATIQMIDRFGSDPGSGELVEIVLGEPDFDSYCHRDGRNAEAVSISAGADAWRCNGVVNGLFAGEDIDFDAACRWEFGIRARSRLVDATRPDGWRCITDP